MNQNQIPLSTQILIGTNWADVAIGMDKVLRLQILKPLGFKVVDVVCRRFQPFDRTNVQSYCNLFLQKSA